MKDFIEELRWRGMIHDVTVGLEDELRSGPKVGYIGFDPTAPSMTLGNFVQVMILRHFQLAGHRPIILLGGATGRVGDPSGKDKERELKTSEELDFNLNKMKTQISKFLNFEGKNAAIIVNNYDFYSEMNVLDFLRDVGKTITVNYMLKKKSVEKRIENGISFTEFSYQLIQGFDFQKLYENYDCIVQMGGSDQWGNITTGLEFVRRNLDSKVYAVTTPLLTKSDGGKFGKSEKGNIWMDAELTSPYEFYQFWLKSDDQDLPKFYRYFSLKNKDEIEALELEHKDDPRTLKKILAEEITIRVHGAEGFESVLRVSELLFSKKMSAESLSKLVTKDLEMVKNEIPSFEIENFILQNGGVNILDLLVDHTHIVSSKGDGRRSINANSLSVNKSKVTSHEIQIAEGDLLQKKYIMIENGKKNKFLIKFI